MRFKMRGDRIERRVERLVIRDTRTLAPEAGEKRAWLRGLGEKPMHIAAAHKAIGRRRAIAASIGETQDGPGAIRPKTPANMHFIAAEGNAVLRPGTVHRRKQFVAIKVRFNIEQA